MDQFRYLAFRTLAEGGDGDVSSHWHAFRMGNWTVVDQFDTHGRRYVIARRETGQNCLSPDDTALLARRARGDTLKFIAMDLGVSVSSVSRRLSTAMTKLGIKSNVELPVFFRSD